MPDWIANMPMWLSTLVVLAACVIVCVGGHLILRAVLPGKRRSDEAELAVALMTVSAAFIGIMLAFSAVQVWQEYGDADKAVSEEAAAAAQLYRLLDVYGDDARPARRALAVYVRSAVQDEWPRMAQGEGSPRTADALADVFDAMAKIQPETPHQTVIYGEAFKKLDEVVEQRRTRLIAAHTALPGLFWVVVLIGSAIIVGYTVAFPSTPMNLLLIAGVAVSLGLVFVFILDVEYPFDGLVSVTPAEMQGLTPLFEKLESR